MVKYKKNLHVFLLICSKVKLHQKNPYEIVVDDLRTSTYRMLLGTERVPSKRKENNTK